MSQQNNGDLSPPDGYVTPSSGSPLERLAAIEAWASEFNGELHRAVTSRDSQHAAVLIAISNEARRTREAEAEAARRDEHLANGLLTLGGAVGEARQEIKALAKTVGRLADGGAEREGVLMAEMAKVRSEIGALHRQDSLTDVTLTDIKGEVQKQGGALAKIGAQVTWVNAFKASVLGAVTAIATHPTEVLELLGKVLDRLAR